ncbi:hypothetical protein SDC9_174257 [bioreactor metagenome]|uniref:Solute-binding protein n=1 Tax=bioreactor metagenome TaxID=1076179 RepID=A0A645GLT6_9ZZZZ
MNLDKFKGLSDEDKKIIEDAFDKQCRASITSIKAEDEKYMDLMKKEGINVVTFTQDEIDAISKDIRENVWPNTYDLFPKEMLDGVLADLNK